MQGQEYFHWENCTQFCSLEDEAPAHVSDLSIKSVSQQSLSKMDAFNRFHKCFYTYIRTLLAATGHDYFVPYEWKPGPLTFMAYAILLIASSFNLYTILFYDPFTVVNASMFMCLVSQVGGSKVILLLDDASHSRNGFPYSSSSRCMELNSVPTSFG